MMLLLFPLLLYLWNRYVRGGRLFASNRVHVSGVGDFKVEVIASADDPLPVKVRQRRKH